MDIKGKTKKLQFRLLTTIPTMRVPEQERITRPGLRQIKEEIAIKKPKPGKNQINQKDITLEKCFKTARAEG